MRIEENLYWWSWRGRVTDAWWKALFRLSHQLVRLLSREERAIYRAHQRGEF